MAETKLDVHQIGGLDFETLAEELVKLKEDTKHIKGTVEREDQLVSLTVPKDSLVFVQENNKFYKYNGTAWGAILGDSAGGGGGDGTALELKQVTRLGVTATVASPAEIILPIDYTSDFKRPPIEVLKFVSTGSDVLQTQIAFDAADATKFTANPNVIFDGTLRLRTEYTYEMVNEGPLGEGTLFSHVIDKTKFKSIEKIEVF